VKGKGNPIGRKKQFERGHAAFKIMIMFDFLSKVVSIGYLFYYALSST
jgi:hypothetical protein